MVVSKSTDSSDENMNESDISQAESENSFTSTNNRLLGIHSSSDNEFFDDPSLTACDSLLINGEPDIDVPPSQNSLWLSVDN